MNITKLVPKEWIVDKDSNSVKLWFSSSRGNHNRKAFTFPKKVIIDETFAEAIGMIMGDADMHRKEKRHLTFASRDLESAVFVFKFFRNRLFVNQKDITITIYHGKNKPNQNMYASLGVNIKMLFSERHNYPVIHLQINGSVFRLVFERIFYSFISSDFFSNSNLRRGFLRGLFSAEGCVGVKKREQYINQISFTLGSKEQEFVNLLQKALSLEGITFKTVERRNSIETIIQNWQNYLKLWQIKLFDRCERKKKTFLDVAKNSTVYAVIDLHDLKGLSERFTQRELAKIIGSWQGNVSRILKRDILLSLKQIDILNQKGINLNIKSLRVGNLTELPYSEEIEYLFISEKYLPDKIKKQDLLD